MNSVAFSPKGEVLASSSTDRTVILWRVREGRPFHILRRVGTGARLATLLKLPDGWVAFRPDGGFKSLGELAGVFWHAIGLCRFEPGELDSYLPQPLSISDNKPFLLG